MCQVYTVYITVLQILTYQQNTEGELHRNGGKCQNIKRSRTCTVVIKIIQLFCVEMEGGPRGGAR